MSVDTIQELCSYDQWANDNVLGVAAGLPDEKLDRPFEIGPGTLRETARHIYHAQRVWYERIGGLADAKLPHSQDLPSAPDIHAAAARLADLRSRWLTSLDPRANDRQVAYLGADGKQHAYRLADILLHVINHSIHHRAQALNMMRHLGAQPPTSGADYIFMYVDDQARPAPALDLDVILRYSAYSSWAFAQAADAATGLSDEQLDRPLEMGLGTLRKTLVHIHDAEVWWQHNWLDGPGHPFPTADLSLAPARLRELFVETAKRRNEFIAAKTADVLRQLISIVVRQVKQLTFPLGVTMLQLCCHGTHHRAQAMNMLRRLGATPPKLDLLLWARTA
jgi:uncharacterized damage-inducible protein DinB